MEHFEDDLKIALTRLKRAELKTMLQNHDEDTFEADTANAFKSLEKKRLKTLFVNHTVEKKTVKNPFMSYWKYAAAACMVFGVGLFIYTNNKVSIDNVALNKTKIPPPNNKIKAKVPNVNKSKEAKSQIFESKVFSEEIGQLGFANMTPFNLKIFVNSTFKGLEYKLHQNVFEIRSSKKIDVKIYQLEEQSYFRLNKEVFKLQENHDFERPKKSIRQGNTRLTALTQIP